MEMTIYLLFLAAAFGGVVFWAFDRKSKARFDARISFEDENG